MKHLVVALCCLFAASAVICKADEVQLLNGRTYQVSAWRVDGDNLILTLMDGRLVTVNRASVTRISITQAAEKQDVTQARPLRVRGQASAELSIPIPEALLPPLDRGNVAAALDALDASAETYRETTPYYLLRATLLLRCGEYADAEALFAQLGDALERYPGALYSRAQVLFFMGEWEQARTLYTALLERVDAADIYPAARNRIDLIDRYAGGSVLRGDGIILRAMAGVANAERAKTMATAALIHVVDALAARPAQDLLIIVDTAPPEREETTGSFSGLVRLSTETIDRPEAEAIITHEIVHAMLLARTRGNAPVWLHEGLACHLSGQSLLASGSAAAPVGEIYRDGLGLVEYLIAENGEQGIQRLLDSFAAGLYEDDAAQAACGAPVNELRRRRNAWLSAR